MGLIGKLFSTVFGSRRNLVVETAEMFRENAEAQGVREAEFRSGVVAQYAAEMARQRRGLWDRLIDGLNRLPRPLMAFGTLGLIVSAMLDPVWFAARMQGLALVPEPLWWLMGAIVSFYFGARMQSQGQAFQRSVAETLSRLPQVEAGLRDLEARAATKAAAPQVQAANGRSRPVSGVDGNAALEDWRRTQP